MPLGTNQMTVTTAANFIPELWALDVIEAAESKLVMANLVERFDDLAAEGGDTIHIPNVSNLTANDKVANTQVTLNSPTEAKTDITIATHKEVSFVIEDIVATQSKKSLREVYTKKAGYAIAKAIDTHLCGLYSGLSQSVNAGAAVTKAHLLSAMTYLDDADAPVEDRYLVIRPVVKADILNITADFTSADYIRNGQPAPLATGMIGDCLGFQVFQSTNVAAVTVTSTTYHCLAFQKGAFALAVQLGPRVQASYEQAYLGWLITLDVIYGYKLLRDTYAVDVYTT